MTTRRASDLEVPPVPLNVEKPPSRALPFPFILGPHIVLGMAERQRERATKKAVARYARRRRRRR